jgi:hypothetical protein
MDMSRFHLLTNLFAKKPFCELISKEHEHMAQSCELKVQSTEKEKVRGWGRGQGMDSAEVIVCPHDLVVLLVPGFELLWRGRVRSLHRPAIAPESPKQKTAIYII